MSSPRNGGKARECSSPLPRPASQTLPVKTSPSTPQRAWRNPPKAATMPNVLAMSPNMCSLSPRSIQRERVRRIASQSFAGERLSWLSSGLPWSLIPENGVEDGQELSGDSDKGDHFWLSRSDEALMDGFERWIVFFGDHGAQEEHRTDGRPATAYEALTAPAAGLAGEGR